MRSLVVVVLVAGLLPVLLAQLTQNQPQNGHMLPGPKWLQGIQDYEVVIPTRVDENGNPYPHSHHFRKRSIREDGEYYKSQQTNPHVQGDPNIPQWDTHAFYTMEAFGQKFHLHLKPSSDFIAPNVRIQYMDGNKTWLGDELDGNRHCFYAGTVNTDIQSAAALSVCNSLLGSFHVNGVHYTIEPHPDHKNSSVARKPHILNRHRSNSTSQEKHNSTCGYEGIHKHERWKNNQNKMDDSTMYYSSSSSSHHRQKRSMSWERHVEVMVVVDAEMASYHGSHLKDYVLTLMSIVASIYKDPSIGSAINIVVVKFMVLSPDQTEPGVSANAASTLQNFCLWQQKQNEMDDSSPLHHDTAVLITRHDICRSARECDTLGLAEVGTMCDSYRSCSITEDNGLSASFTIAHELGHVFNLPHDDDKIRCRRFSEFKSRRFHVMSPTLDHNTNPWTWSTCSVSFLTEFLDAGYGECLLDRPVESKVIKLHTTDGYSYGQNPKLPGETFSVDKQCAMVHGGGSRKCPYMPACKRLWCTSAHGIRSGCRTQHMPWADGSHCGPNRWCIKGQCVIRQWLKPENGGWGPWQSWSSCSRRCGGGIKHSKRYCNNPAPSNGGKYCIGRRVKYRSCRTKDCPEGTSDFRVRQCSSFNGQHFNINGIPPSVRWVPKYAGIRLKDQCKLYCRVSGSYAYYILKDKVVDGTKCGPDTSDICVNGKCRKAGCDNRLGSDTKRDRCGVCGGDNTSCKVVQGSFNHQTHYGYNTVTKIPSGSSNIIIQQHGFQNSRSDDNYLALRNGKGEYILNGKFVVSMFHKDIRVKGAVIEYSGSRTHIENITCSKMIKEDIYVMVLSVGKMHPPNIRFSYTVANYGNVQFRWRKDVGRWSECSKICKGKMDRKVVCTRQDDGSVVSDERCRQLRKPRADQLPCNYGCSVGWQVIDQGGCSSRCGIGTRNRLVQCVKHQKSHVEAVDERHCRWMGRKPGERIACRGQCLPTHWSYSKWSDCSVTCGGGEQTRTARCLDANNRQLREEECGHDRKIVRQQCNTNTCTRWEATPWTGCSVTCGKGTRFRSVYCKRGHRKISKYHCDAKSEPSKTESCERVSCPTWRSGNWQECSVTCGKGVQQRRVQCMNVYEETVDDVECDAAMRPQHQKPCNLLPCTTTPPPTTTTQAVPVKVQAVRNFAQPVHSPNAHHPGGREVQWRTGSWTQCSASCGPGKRKRYVSCRDSEGNIAKNEDCSHIPKPTDTESCVIKHCGDWRSGQWGECSVTCGEGSQTRYVACIMHNKIVSEEHCDENTKPAVRQVCDREACNTVKEKEDKSSNDITSGFRHWRIGGWGECSSTCGQGWMRRRVECYDENGLSDKCDTRQKPPDVKHCHNKPCPYWNYGAWGPCSVTCGSGIQNRVVICQQASTQSLPDSHCDLQERPTSSRRCIGLPPCNSSNPRWRSSTWSPCSVTCGRGHRTRNVTCEDVDGIHDDEHCEGRKPRQVANCFRKKCPSWTADEWSQCSDYCDESKKIRKIRCRDSLFRVTDPDTCPPHLRPVSVMNCQNVTCNSYSWRPMRWSKCSVSCGYGRRLRNVTCVNKTTNLVVSPRQCRSKVRPRSSRRCYEMNCAYAWTTEPWSECNAECGLGQQSRNVTCQHMTKEGWLLPVSNSSCDVNTKPTAHRQCSYGVCGDKYHWSVTEWRKCSKPCGRGRAKRKVFCADELDRKVARRHCNRTFKPESKQPCNMHSCMARSCKEIRLSSGKKIDGEYRLMVSNRPIQIYCTGMQTSEPKEFVSLKSVEENFAEIYEKRLIEPDTCPYEGARNESCACLNNTYSQSGMSVYSKIRLNITSMQVITTDYTFAHHRGYKKISYGSAGDCYSSTVCPQGRFHINLTGTGFRVASVTLWANYGNNANHRIEREESGQVVEGWCGGFCGKCSPHPDTGLLLQTFP